MTSAVINRAPAVRLELIFAESAFIKTYLYRCFWELLTRTIDLTIQTKSKSSATRIPRKYMKMLIQQKLMLGARLSDLLW